MQASGILLVDKPKGLSSAAVVAKIKRQFRFDKVGHGGTLDPFATGLLVILVGEGTKIARFLLEGSKNYLATSALGRETNTGDETGESLVEAGFTAPALLAQDWEKVRAQFEGNILQKPPAFSALKRDGKRLYELARAGEIVETEARPVTIHELKLLECAESSLQFFVRCGGGTYIRSLAADWARAAGTRAHLKELRRLETLGFRIDQSHSLDHLLSLSEAPLLPLEAALAHLPRLECSLDQANRVRQGNLSSLQLPADAATGFYFLHEGNTPVAILQRSDAWSLERGFCL